MRRFVVLIAVLLLAGCDTTSTRIHEHAAEFAALSAAAQRNIRHGSVEPGYTSDMVYMALGRPAAVSNDASGDVNWEYRRYPVTAYNETIRSGFRERVVYDPVKRGPDIIVEPIDPKAFPNLVPHTLRLTFRNDHVVTIERIPDLK
ncbi:MAG TPA: hypothetical protein VHE61_13395 [Opitutaceae bacterium]|nr:hypothetical protein [Opitutaceae bacterium]